MAKYKFVGYGSLLSHRSFHPSEKDAKILGAVIVKGYKRIFDISESGKNSDVLNVEKSSGSEFNGILFEVDERELGKLSDREDWYNFEPVKVYDFKTKKPLGKALVCVDHYLFIDKRKELPAKDYFILCREAAYHLSGEFGKFWDETTFLSNGEKVAEWIKNHKVYDTINK